MTSASPISSTTLFTTSAPASETQTVTKTPIQEESIISIKNSFSFFKSPWLMCPCAGPPSTRRDVEIPSPPSASGLR